MKKFKFINDLPCCKCNALPKSEAAHIRKGTQAGIAQKPDDKWLVPLCHDCHAKQHRIGEVSFWGDVLHKAKELALLLDFIYSDNRCTKSARHKVLYYRRFFI